MRITGWHKIPLRLRRERSVERKGGYGVVILHSIEKTQPPLSPFIKGDYLDNFSCIWPLLQYLFYSERH